MRVPPLLCFSPCTWHWATRSWSTAGPQRPLHSRTTSIRSRLGSYAAGVFLGASGLAFGQPSDSNLPTQNKQSAEELIQSLAESHAELLRQNLSPEEVIRRTDEWLKVQKPILDQLPTLQKGDAPDPRILDAVIKQARADNDLLALAVYQAQKDNLPPEQRIRRVDRAIEETLKTNPNDVRLARQSSAQSIKEFGKAAEARIKEMDAKITAATDPKTGAISFEKLQSLNK